MWDFIYLVTTAVFFALMLAYVVGCARLGRGHSAANAQQR
jgi:hypothetical protein